MAPPEMGVAGLDHVLVLSDDIDGSRDFYCRSVGMTVGERPPLPFPGYWLYAGGRPCLHIADREIYTAHARSAGLSVPNGGVDHLAFSADDYDDAAQRLERDGVRAVRNSVPEAGLRQLFFDGPDGVRIEVNVFEPAREGAAAREA
jgi:catechol 2,3-dioxygenase-like lactoylglutathione lyase family enzyme